MAMEILVTVKAYPTLSQKYGEVVCVAGITLTEPYQWVRLYPVGFRDLPYEDRFHKYDVVRIDTTEASDKRPETHRPVLDSLEVIGKASTNKDWAERRKYVMPTVSESMCEIARLQQSEGKSLGCFKPREIDFVVEKDDDSWSGSQEGIAGQISMFMPAKDSLEKVPHRFMYHYRCDDASCNGHKQTIVDWEAMQSYRSWRERYSETELMDALRKKWLDTMWADGRDSYLFVGNQFMYPASFLTLGVFWPPATGELPQAKLF